MPTTPKKSTRTAGRKTKSPKAPHAFPTLRISFGDGLILGPGKVELLETTELIERLRLVLDWVKEALAEHELADKIRHDVSEGLESRQREFLLHLGK